jgi:aspartate/methionine/tyrosine aminotransferase
MTGWRLGFGIMPESLAERMGLLLTHSVGCTAHFTQIAGIEALTGPQEEATRMVTEYQRRRDLIVDGLNKLPGIHCLKPQAAFYAFPNIQKTNKSSQEVANLMLNGGVALLPGSTFGSYGEGYLRVVFANSAENIKRALERMEKVLKELF